MRKLLVFVGCVMLFATTGCLGHLHLDGRHHGHRHYRSSHTVKVKHVYRPAPRRTHCPPAGRHWGGLRR